VTKVSTVLWKEEAKAIMEKLGLSMVGDVKSITARVNFEVMSAAGRRKILVTVNIVDSDSLKKPIKKYVSPFGETSSGVQ